ARLCAAFMVVQLSVRRVDNAPPAGEHSQAVVDVAVIEGELLGKAAERAEQVGTRHQAGPGDRGTVAVHQGIAEVTRVRPGKAIEGAPRGAAGAQDTRVLQLAAGEKELGADSPDLRML